MFGSFLVKGLGSLLINITSFGCLCIFHLHSPYLFKRTTWKMQCLVWELSSKYLGPREHWPILEKFAKL